MQIRKIFGFFAVAVLLSAFCWADDVNYYEDPATLHVGPGPGPCATGGCPLYKNETNALAQHVDIYQNSNAAPPLTAPVLVIIGVPNDNGSAMNSSSLLWANILQNGQVTDTAGSNGTFTPVTSTFGSTQYGLNGYVGAMTDGQEIYSFLAANSTLSGGLDAASKANNSNSFTNWAGWDNHVMPSLFPSSTSVNDFGIYVFALNTGQFSGGDFLNMQFNGVPLGSFVVGYGQTEPSNGKITIYDTPFTEAGLVNHIPEPTTLAFFLLPAAFWAFSRKKLSIV
jgi:hypothetical protein